MISNIKLLYYNLPSEHSKEVLEFVQLLFKPEPVLNITFDPAASKKNEFYCPELNVLMSQPCAIEACPFYTANDWVGNCIINYVTKQEKTVLGYNELTFLLNENTASVRAQLGTLIKKLRSGALKDRIIKNQETGLFYRLRDKGICPVCETSIVDRSKAVSKKRVVYCSSLCATYKPPFVLALEDEFNLSIEKILTLCKAHFTSLSIIASLLRTTQATVKHLYKKYLLPLPSLD